MERGRVLLVDNVDSFTFNVADLLHRVLGRAPTVWHHDHPATEEDLARFGAIVVGPGPGRPQQAEDLGISDLALRQRRVPVLGVCLGHQGLAHLVGDEVVELAEPVHGQVHRVHHDGTGILADLPSPFEVVRYHSLEVRLRDGSPLVARAWAETDGCVMALEDTTGDVVRWGVQFHPESVLSEHGERLLRAFLRAARVPLLPPDDGPVAVGDAPVAHTRGRRPPRRMTLRRTTVEGRVDGWRLHDRLVGESRSSFWLDSSAGERDREAAAPAARFSVIGDGAGPLGRELTHTVAAGGPPFLATVQKLLDAVELDTTDLDAGPPLSFRPGLVGYLGYELRAETAPGRPDAARHTSRYPDGWLLLADRAVVVDHVAGLVHLVHAEDRRCAREQRAWLERTRQVVEEEVRRGPDPWPDPPAAVGDGPVLAGLRHTGTEYEQLVRRCQEQIRAGESYELCLTTEVAWPEPVEGARAYRQLRAASPVPFGAWLRMPALQVLSASPERFVAVDPDGTVEARPIKGTRPRDADPERDAALAAELAVSVKDRAENLMIVDLLRNDLHRVCRSGTVTVPGLFEVESYTTVHQLVSTVRGRLAPGMGPVDVLASCFPGGSMTGAPKVRSMDILAALEGRARGVYSGTLGWVGLDGAMDTSIVIRTVTVADGRARFGIGGAVTVLSDPAAELAEVLDKARAAAGALTAAALDEPRAALATTGPPSPPRVEG